MCNDWIKRGICIISLSIFKQQLWRLTTIFHIPVLSYKMPRGATKKSCLLEVSFSLRKQHRIQKVLCYLVVCLLDYQFSRKLHSSYLVAVFRLSLLVIISGNTQCKQLYIQIHTHPVYCVYCFLLNIQMTVICKFYEVFGKGRWVGRFFTGFSNLPPPFFFSLGCKERQGNINTSIVLLKEKTEKKGGKCWTAPEEYSIHSKMSPLCKCKDK